MGVEPQELDYPKEFVEVDPTGRYGRADAFLLSLCFPSSIYSASRFLSGMIHFLTLIFFFSHCCCVSCLFLQYNEMLGKGASKIVYRAFDEYEGIEVAWNQVKLHHFLQSPDDLERLYCEIHLLKTLKHENIMKFYTSWVDVTERNINFVTEMFTSGTLRQYRQKHRRVNIRAVKHWCRQILKGLVYLHSHDPPVIHRDLKCDNIFINGNQGEVKIGDLGLAAILRNSHAVHCVGTPEFMAPEVYQEEYNELVDIYSFGMCILEMVTFEYPYSECTRPVQIYKKVMSGTKPEALYRVNDLEVRQFVEKCLATVSQRLTAKELLTDRFLQIDDCGSGCWEGGIIGMSNLLRLPSYSSCYSNGSLITNGFFEDFPNETNKEGEQNFNAYNIEGHGIKLFNSPGDEPFTMDITIKGTKKEDGGIFLRLRIIDTEGRARNIYFPFDIEADTAVGVAMEMVAELEITDHEVTRIAELIDGQVLSLAPRWESTLGKEEMSAFPITDFCDNCTSNASSCVSLLDYVSGNKLSSNNLQACHSSQLKCPAMHGRFGEVMYQDKGPEQSQLLSRSQLDVLDLSSRISGDSHFDEELSDLDQTVDDKTVVIHMNDDNPTNPRKFLDRRECLENRPNDYENEIRQELRLLKAKYQAEHRDCSNQHLEGMTALNPSPESEKGEFRVKDKASVTAASKPLETMKSFHFGRHFSFRLPPHHATSPTMANKSAYSSNGYSHNGHPDMDGQRDLDCDSAFEQQSRENFYCEELLRQYSSEEPSCQGQLPSSGCYGCLN